MENKKINVKLHKMCAAALLCAIGILIPIIMPIKLIIEPMSFTLGSHIVLFIAMFLSPGVAAFVSVGTTVGFLIGGFPLIVVLRAASQLVFVMLGAFALKARPSILSKPADIMLFGLLTGIVHAICEVLVCCVFYFSGMVNYSNAVSVLLLLVGVGTLVHSCIDYTLSLAIYKVLQKEIRFPVSAKLLKNTSE